MSRLINKDTIWATQLCHKVVSTMNTGHHPALSCWLHESHTKTQRSNWQRAAPRFCTTSNDLSFFCIWCSSHDSMILFMWHERGEDVWHPSLVSILLIPNENLIGSARILCSQDLTEKLSGSYYKTWKEPDPWLSSDSCRIRFRILEGTCLQDLPRILTEVCLGSCQDWSGCKTRE